jgi:hypothetical protein
MDDDFSFEDDDFSIEDDSDIQTARTLKSVLRLERKAAERVFINDQKRAALAEIMPCLPGTDTDLFIITAGLGAEANRGVISHSPDLGTFIPHIVALLGDKDCIVYISTWTCNHWHAQTMLELLDTGRVKSLCFFSDPYFMQRSPAIATPLVTGLKERGQQVKLWKNHTKILAIANHSESRSCVVMSSANLSAQPRAEQLHISSAPAVYQWVRDAFFLAMLKQPDYQPKFKRPRKPKVLLHAAQENTEAESQKSDKG